MATPTSRDGFAWLELMLVCAVVTLVFMMFPSLWQAIDFRNWSKMTALVVNLLAIIFLVVAKASPQLLAEFRQKQQKNAASKSKAEKAKSRKEKREALERAKESLKRRKF